MKSVLSRNEELRRSFFECFGDRCRTVGEHFADHGNMVEIADTSPWLPELVFD